MLRPGTRVGRFEVVSLVGAVGMGEDAGKVKVLDFGLAKPLADGEPLDRSAATEEALTAVGTVAGTPTCMAPESTHHSGRRSRHGS